MNICWQTGETLAGNLEHASRAFLGEARSPSRASTSNRPASPRRSSSTSARTPSARACRATAGRSSPPRCCLRRRMNYSIGKLNNFIIFQTLLQFSGKNNAFFWNCIRFSTNFVIFLKNWRNSDKISSTFGFKKAKFNQKMLNIE